MPLGMEIGLMVDRRYNKDSRLYRKSIRNWIIGTTGKEVYLAAASVCFLDFPEKESMITCFPMNGRMFIRNDKRILCKSGTMKQDILQECYFLRG